jgi:DNA-directed RNA polymerase subunit omega
MLNPSIGKLIEQYESKYGVVIAVAKRAREIAEENQENDIHNTEKEVDLAMNELAEGKFEFNEIA